MSTFSCERVCTLWRSIAMEATRAETKPVWVYVIFRKNHCSGNLLPPLQSCRIISKSSKNHCLGHEKMTVNISFDGPIFWNRQVAYIYCCSCHFDEHEVRVEFSCQHPLTSLFSRRHFMYCSASNSYSPHSFPSLITMFCRSTLRRIFHNAARPV